MQQRLHHLSFPHHLPPVWIDITIRYSIQCCWWMVAFLPTAFMDDAHALRARVGVRCVVAVLKFWSDNDTLDSDNSLSSP